MSQKGLFVVVDSTDGSGKSSMIKTLHTNFIQRNLDVWLTEESTRGPFGLSVRELIRSHSPLDPWTLAMLFATDRIHHRLAVHEALAKGRLVLCDRYIYSGIAFSTYNICVRDHQCSRNHVRQALSTLHEQLPLPTPDLAIVMSVPAPLAIKRIKERGRKEFLKEFETETAIEKVHEEFHALGQSGLYPKMRIVDNSESFEKTTAAVLSISDRLFNS